MTRKVSDLYSFIHCTCNTQKKLNDRLRFKVIFAQTSSIGQKQRKHVTKKNVSQDAHSDTTYQFIILHFTFLVFVFLQIDKINIYVRQTTMRNEIHLSKVFVTWVLVAKVRARETRAHKLVNTRVECRPFDQFISWEMNQATTLLLICFSSRVCQLTFGQYCNTIQSSKL